jgi:hypothetical protein
MPASLLSHSVQRDSTAGSSLEDGPTPLSTPAAFGEQLSSLYGLVQRSNHVFASPLGPLRLKGRAFHIPRFVYFGPESSDTSLRLAFLGGVDHRDHRSTLALLHLVEGLAIRPDLGNGLNLSFFPIIDLLGLAGIAPDRGLAKENWASSKALELGLLEQDARLRSYHGFIFLESAPGEEEVSVRLRSPKPVANIAPELEIISSDDIAPFAVRWETDPSGSLSSGPLGIADDLLQHPFELTLRLPASWSTELYREAASSILKRFIIRHRGFISYAQHL